MITNNIFYPLSLNQEIQQYQKKDGPTGFFIEASTPEELEAIAQRKMNEREEQKNQQSAFYKWYYNKFFGLSE